jgi:lipoate-protein ligase A
VVTSGFAGSRLQTYQQICQFLIQGWRSLGVELNYGETGRGYIHNPSCFGTATGADLIIPSGAKLAGSAQLRRGGAILQHGSMPLLQNSQLFQRVFGTIPVPVELPLSQHGDTLIQTVTDALIAGFKNSFGVALVEQPLSDAEWQAILEFRSLIPAI